MTKETTMTSIIGNVTRIIATVELPNGRTAEVELECKAAHLHLTPEVVTMPDDGLGYAIMYGGERVESYDFHVSGTAARLQMREVEPA